MILEGRPESGHISYCTKSVLARVGPVAARRAAASRRAARAAAPGAARVLLLAARPVARGGQLTGTGRGENTENQNQL